MSITADRPSRAIFEEIASIKKIADPAYAEKDWFVTQIIGMISRIEIEGYQIAFSGGTALSKAYKLIERFSEDIDFVVITDKETKRIESSKFKKNLIQKLKDGGLDLDKSQVKSANENQYIVIEMDYPTYFDTPKNLRPHIRIEFVIRKPGIGYNHRSASSFFAEISRRPSEVESILCIDPAEIAADKLSALIWRTHERDRSLANDDPSIIRHLHDIAKLKEWVISFPNFPALVNNSIQGDIGRSKETLFKQKDLKEKLLGLHARLRDDPLYPKEYQKYVDEMSYASDDNKISFDTAVFSLEQLIDNVLGS